MVSMYVYVLMDVWMDVWMDGWVDVKNWWVDLCIRWVGWTGLWLCHIIVIIVVVHRCRSSSLSSFISLLSTWVAPSRRRIQWCHLNLSVVSLNTVEMAVGEECNGKLGIWKYHFWKLSKSEISTPKRPFQRDKKFSIPQVRLMVFEHHCPNLSACCPPQATDEWV